MPHTMADLDLGRRYEIGAELTPGPWSRSFRATQPPTNRPVVITLLSERKHEVERVHRFLLEAETRAKLRHPNIIELIDYGVAASGERFYVAEWVDGPNLSQLLADAQSLAVDRLVHLALQVGRALNEAHQQGIMHGHLTPNRIWFARLYDEAGVEDDVVKVADFGWVTEGDFILPPPAKLPRDGVAGSSAYDYRAPEQIRGDSTDVPADIYSLGALLFHALTGRPPFLGSSDEEVADQHLNAEVPRTRLPRQTGATELEVICRRCLAKDPHDRYPAIPALLRDLRGVQRLIAMTSVAHRVDIDLSRSTISPAGSHAPAPGPAPAGSLDRERSFRLQLWLVVLLCAVATVLFWTLVVR